MNSLEQDLLGLTHWLGSRFELPAVRDFVLPPLEPVDPSRPDDQPWRICNNFAALILADGTVGLTYTAIDDALAGLQRELPGRVVAGLPVIELASLYEQQAGWQRSLGLAAINAISQFAMRRAGVELPKSPGTVEMLAIEPGDRIGMVGWFGRLVEPIRASGASLTVIELNEQRVCHEPGLIVTLDSSALAGCNKILITGTTLLNGTLEGLLELTRGAGQVCLIGPTAGCLPDALFERGLTAIGGTTIGSIDDFMSLWSVAGRWRESGRPYQIERTGYVPMRLRPTCR